MHAAGAFRCDDVFANVSLLDGGVLAEVIEPGARETL